MQDGTDTESLAHGTRRPPWYLKGGKRSQGQAAANLPPPTPPRLFHHQITCFSHRVRRWPILLSLARSLVVLGKCWGARVVRMDNDADPSDSHRLAVTVRSIELARRASR